MPLKGAAHGVSCVMISPTWVETELMHRNVAQVVANEGKGKTVAQAMAEIADQNPQKRIIQPSEVAALAAFLCGDEAGALPPKTSRSPAAPCGEHLAMAQPKIIIDTIMY